MSVGGGRCCRSRLALYSVIAIESVFLGWGTLSTILAIPLLDVANRADSTKQELFKDMPFEVIESEDGSDSPPPEEMAKYAVIGLSIYCFFQTSEVIALIWAHFKRSPRPLIFSFVWCLLSNCIIIAGLVYGMVRVSQMPKTLPKFPVMAWKTPPPPPYPTAFPPPKRITLPPLPAPPLPLENFFQDTMERVNWFLIPLAGVKFLLAIFSLIVMGTLIKIYRQSRIPKPAAV